MMVKRLSGARVVVRTTSVEYLDAWREREIDVDFMVSSELETANAISSLIGIPAARQTDVFADGKVQVVEFDVPEGHNGVVGKPLREADLPTDSKVVSIIRGDRLTFPRGSERIVPNDRIVVIGSPDAARQWSRLISREHQRVDDIVIFGGGRMGTTIAHVLLDRGIRVRFVEGRAERAREVAEELPQARVFHASAFDPEFFERERIGRATAAVFALNDDPGNLFSAVLAKAHGVQLTIALAHDQTFRAESELAGMRFDEMPETGSVVGAIIRGGEAIIPHSKDTLEAGDRVVVFVESRRASTVEKVL
jgi:trk system potassium uptake protein TrkA